VTYNNLTNTGIANIIKEDGAKINIPVKLQILNNNTKYFIIPSPTVRQEKYTMYTYNIPFYYYGSFHKIYLNAEQYNGKYFSNIKVYVKTPSDNDFIEYQIVQNKYLYSGNDNVVFINFIDESNIEIVLGSGINGKYISEGSIVKIDIYTTYGSIGNINANNEILLYSKDKVTLDNILVTNPEFVKLMTTEQITSGADIKSLNELKKDIITYIKTRDTIITKDDIISILELYNVKTYTVTRTYKLFTPTIYIYASFTNPFLQPIKHTTYYIEQETLLNKIFIDDETPINYMTKGFYPVETNIQVIDQISDNVIQVSDTGIFSTGDLIDFSPSYYNNAENLYRITDIDTEQNTLTLDKSLDFDPSGLTIYKYENYVIECRTPFIAVYDELFNRYRTYILIDNFAPVLKELNNQNFIYVPKLTIKLSNIVFDSNSNSYIITINASLTNKDQLPNQFFDIITDKLEIKLPKLNETLSFTDLIKNDTVETEITVSDEVKLFELLSALENIEIEYNISDITTNNIIANYELNTKFLIETSEYVSFTIDNGTIYDIPVFEKNEYEIYKDYIKQKMLDIVTSIPTDLKTPGTEYKILLTNTIELTDNYTKYTDQFTNILLPLKLKIKLIIDPNKQLLNFTTLNDYINYIREQLALELMNNPNYSGIEVAYYPTQIIEFIKQLDKINGEIIKQIEILQPDIYIDVNRFDIDRYYETKIKTKEENLKFTPTYFWFDIDNIEIQYEVK
jgi:hypothetical protein